jgi:hypothetical protein
MVKWLRRTYSPPSCLDAVTLVASQSLGTIMFCMTETDTKRGRGLRRTSITFHLVARATSRDIATIRLRTRRVTAKTICVRIEPCWYGECDATTQRAMATRTTQAAQVLVPRVIETHSKTRKPWKRFYSSRLHVSVTNRANLMSRVCKLFRMTTRAWCVAISARHRRSRLVGLSSMTQETRESGVIRVVMFKF